MRHQEEVQRDWERASPLAVQPEGQEHKLRARWFKSWPGHSLGEQSWATYVTPLCPHFLMCKKTQM